MLEKDDILEKQSLEEKLYQEELNYTLNKRNLSNNKIKFVLRLYSYTGSLSSVIALLYFILSFFKLRITNEQQIALVIFGVGLTISITTTFLFQLLREKETVNNAKKREVQAIGSFMLTWATVERTLTRFAPISNNNRLSIRNTLNYLVDQKKINIRDYLLLENALDIRNKIVHSNLIIPFTELESYDLKLNEIIEKLVKESINDSIE